MHKLPFLMIITILLLLPGCNKPANSLFSPAATASIFIESQTPAPAVTPVPTAVPTPVPTPVDWGVVSDYLPLEDTYYGYNNIDGKLVDSVVEYIDTDKKIIQRRLVQLNRVEVLKANENELALVYYKNGIAYTHNFTSYESKIPTILLKAPLIAGTSWETPDGVSTITKVGCVCLTPNGLYSSIEVVTKQNDGKIYLRYFVKGIGLAAEYYGTAENVGESEKIESSLELKYVENKRPFTQSVKIYYANLSSSSIAYTTRKFNLSANINLRTKFASELRNIPSGSGLLTIPSGTKILSIKPDLNGLVTINFSSQLVEGLNIGLTGEKLMLQAITNTFADYYNAKRVKILVEADQYISKNMMLGESEYFVPKYN